MKYKPNDVIVYNHPGINPDWIGKKLKLLKIEGSKYIFECLEYINEGYQRGCQYQSLISSVDRKSILIVTRKNHFPKWF